jgi:adenylyl-sulfate kinase
MSEQNNQGVYARTLRLEDGLIAPYGGELVQAFVPTHEKHDLLQRITQMKRVDIAAGELVELKMIACGAYSPLSGFMDKQTYTGVLDSMLLPNGMPWGLPVTLAVTAAVAKSINAGVEVALYRNDEVVGVMQVRDIFAWDADKEAILFGEGVKYKYPQIAERKLRKVEYLLGGPVSMLASRAEDAQHKKNIWPHDLRNLIVENGWHNLAAIHLRNPWQRNDEYLLKSALVGSDALLLHLCNEITHEKGGLLPSVLAGASRLLLENYFPNDRVLENPMPDGLFGSSPRAALQHAILSQNYGCSSIYLPLSNEVDVSEKELLEVFVGAGKHGLSIRRVLLDKPFHCDLCGGIATEKSCPHDAAHHVIYSESDIVGRMLLGEHLPPNVARPDIARAVARGMADTAVRGETVGTHLYPHVSEISRELLETIAGHKAGVLWMTGLSGSGKSTIAHRIERELILSGHRVYVLDGDTLRTGLNRDLAFGDEARRENLRRAAEVVKVMIDAGLIVIASFISPFAAERQMVRDIVGGNFFEIYVEANLETCEERDPKGLYKRARAGVIPKFTGISSPYEAPEHPELRLNTSDHSLDECVKQFTDFIAHAGLMRATKYDRLNAALSGKAGK